MQIRAWVGRPRPFREMVVRPRPTATSPSTFALAALGTVTVLTATIIGVSQLGAGLGPTGHIGGRILAIPQTTSTSPFSGFGTPAPLPITIPPENTSPGTPSPGIPSPGTPSPGTPSLSGTSGSTTGQSNIGSAVEAAAAHAQTPAGVRNQGVTAVSAVLNVPSARVAAKPVVTVVSVASAFPSAIVAAVPAFTPSVMVVPRSSSKRRDGTSEPAVRHHKAKAKAHKPHARDGKAAKDGKATEGA